MRQVCALPAWLTKAGRSWITPAQWRDWGNQVGEGTLPFRRRNGEGDRASLHLWPRSIGPDPSADGLTILRAGLDEVSVKKRCRSFGEGRKSRIDMADSNLISGLFVRDDDE